MDSVIYHDFQDSNILHPFFDLESQIMLLHQIFFLMISKLKCFTRDDLKKLLEKTLNISEGHMKILVSTTCWLNIIFVLKTPEAAKVVNSVKCWKNLGMIPSSRF